MRVGVIGAGALGLFYGALLQKSGLDVRYLMRRDLSAVQSRGLSVTSPQGDFHLPAVQAFATPVEIGPVDLVLIGLKTYANESLVELVRPLVDSTTTLLTLQNGLGNEEVLVEAFGPERVLGGIAFLCSNRGEPGVVHHLGQGRIQVGEFQGGLTRSLRKVAALFEAAGVSCEAVADLRRARWEKLVWNIPFNGLCALTGCDVTELLIHPPSRQQIRALMEEVIAGANAQDLREPIDGESFISRLLDMTDGMDHYRPSMMIDRLEGRPLELEAIYTIPLRYARDKGVEMARVELLHALLDLGEE